MDYLIIKNSTFITKGIIRSIIGNVVTQQYFFVPNSMIDFLKQSNKKPITVIINETYQNEKDTANEYINWLLENNLCLISKDAHYYTDSLKSKIKWDIPYAISNCIIEINNENMASLSKLASLIEDFYIPHLEIRSWSIISQTELKDIIEIIQKTSINSLTIFLPYNKDINQRILNKTLQRKTVLNELIFFNAPKTKKYFTLQRTTAIKYIKDVLSNCSCGVTNSKYFFVNNDFYQESRSYNSCLNKKIAIDVHGNIKNCPSMKQSFGNIYEGTTIEMVTQNENFKKLWSITKNQIAICKTCEFRDICMDCRAYLQNPNDILSKPLKCGYNPKTGVWDDWKKSPMNKFSINHYKL